MADRIRVRFAPSPTGYLHVGGLRTALFNYLFARHHRGIFVLRIEDTDQERLIPGAVENLINTLKWAGIIYDEGPDIGGEYGPYIQSQRLNLYEKYTGELLKSGHAYYCFCTPEDLEKMRETQKEKGLNPKYDGTCRNLTMEVVEDKLKKGVPHVIRLKMPQKGETKFLDLIRGEITVENELVDDQVLIKSDGFPTYHLANVVDDHLMGITHVMRGEEWLLSVAKHLQIYKALGWQPPQMAHLSLLLSPDRSKLSKRQGDVAVEDFMAKGYLPEALINYVALLGWNPGTEQEFFTMEELVEQFSLERVGKAGAVFDMEKLNWMNAHYIRQMPEEKRVEFLIPFMENAGLDVTDRERTKKMIAAVYKHIHKGEDIVEETRIFYIDEVEISEPEALDFLKKESSKIVLEYFLTALEKVDELNVDSFRQIMKTIQEETGIKKQELWMPVRIALTGVTHGPELPIVIEIFGKSRAEMFTRQVLQKYINK